MNLSSIATASVAYAIQSGCTPEQVLLIKVFEAVLDRDQAEIEEQVRLGTYDELAARKKAFERKRAFEMLFSLENPSPPPPVQEEECLWDCFPQDFDPCAADEEIIEEEPEVFMLSEIVAAEGEERYIGEADSFSDMSDVVEEFSSDNCEASGFSSDITVVESGSESVKVKSTCVEGDSEMTHEEIVLDRDGAVLHVHFTGLRTGLSPPRGSIYSTSDGFGIPSLYINGTSFAHEAENFGGDDPLLTPKCKPRVDRTPSFENLVDNLASVKVFTDDESSLLGTDIEYEMALESCFDTQWQLAPLAVPGLDDDLLSSDSSYSEATWNSDDFASRLLVPTTSVKSTFLNLFADVESSGGRRLAALPQCFYPTDLFDCGIGRPVPEENLDMFSGYCQDLSGNWYYANPDAPNGLEIVPDPRDPHNGHDWHHGYCREVWNPAVRHEFRSSVKRSMPLESEYGSAKRARLFGEKTKYTEPEKSYDCSDQCISRFERDTFESGDLPDFNSKAGFAPIRVSNVETCAH